MVQSKSETIAIRTVTDVPADWSDQGEDEEGRSSSQLIRESGAP